ncbi:protein Iojap-related, mitochondrial-like [Silene latifolia]|uniref:protein Iojap-related, mitochondrial-like n=1 Tax=Silene latifolia TaxID=37657 RepID=UPI003D76B282
MLAALRSRSSAIANLRPHLWNLNRRNMMASLTPDIDGKTEILKLEEVEQVLREVHADDVRVIPVSHFCDWTDYMVFATGRSTWHVRNIAEALVYKAKRKQKDSPRMLLPSLDGEETANWIVIDSGTVMVHALDEQARAYYDLESHWTKEKTSVDSDLELDKAMVKVRPKNNSKRKSAK